MDSGEEWAFAATMYSGIKSCAHPRMFHIGFAGLSAAVTPPHPSGEAAHSDSDSFLDVPSDGEGLWPSGGARGSGSWWGVSFVRCLLEVSPGMTQERPHARSTQETTWSEPRVTPDRPRIEQGMTTSGPERDPR